MLASGQAGAARVLLQLPSQTRLKHLGVLTDQGWAPGFVQELEEEGAGSKGPCYPSSGCWFPSCPPNTHIPGLTRSHGDGLTVPALSGAP